MKVFNPLIVAIVAGASVSASAQSLSTGFTGSVTSLNNGAGAYFNVTALHPQGIVIDSFDIHSAASAGTSVHAHVLYKPGVFSGFEQNIAAWLPLGDDRVSAAGVGMPTPLPVGGLHIRQGETYALRVGVSNGNHRYNNEATTVPLHANSDVEIQLGSVQNGYFFTGSPFEPRGWNGTIHYTIGANVVLGACCLPDGSCIDEREDVCLLQGGVFDGQSQCAGVSCPQPAPGACCLPDDTCIVEWAPTCEGMNGVFHGYGTACGSEACGRISAPFDGGTIGAGMFAGNFFNIRAVGGMDVIVRAFDVNLSSSAGTNVAVRVYFRPGPWEGFESTPSEWTLLAEVPVFAAGASNPTRVTLPEHAWFTVPVGETYGLRIGPSAGSLRYSTSFTNPISTAHLELDRGAAQSRLWDTISANRGWNGNIYYTPASPTACYADCDGNQTLNIDDFLCYINEFAQAQSLPPAQQISHYANCDGSTTEPVLTIDDFLCFINEFAQGCP